MSETPKTSSELARDLTPGGNRLRAAVDEERRTRHFTIPMLREEFGQDWPVVSAELRRNADAAVDDLFEQLGRVEAIAQNAVDHGFLHQNEWQNVLEAVRG